MLVASTTDFKDRIHTSTEHKKYSRIKHTTPSSGSTPASYGQSAHRRHRNTPRDTIDRSIFKITALEQKEGIEKTFNDIQILLNKMSNKNYHENTKQILDLIQTNNLYDNPENIRKIADFIFMIVSQNAFFSELYSNLFVEFSTQFSVFNTILIEKVDEFAAYFKEFKYVESTDNYEEYCAFNKANDAKKATAAFFIHLVARGTLHNASILQIVDVLQGIIMSRIETETTTGLVDEVFEFMAIFMSATKITLYDKDNMYLLDNVETISKMIPKQYKSVSSRIIFKAIDLYDKIHK
jgi:hypothetical protein